MSSKYLQSLCLSPANMDRFQSYLSIPGNDDDVVALRDKAFVTTRKRLSIAVATQLVQGVPIMGPIGNDLIIRRELRYLFSVGLGGYFHIRGANVSRDRILRLMEELDERD